MEPLSTQLQSLTDKAKSAEAVAGAARDRDRAVLEAHRDRLRESWDRAITKARQEFDNDDAALQFRWSQIRERVKGQFAELHERADQRRADHDARRAERHAERAELDAAEAVDFAALAIDGAMAAVIDAVLARADADAAAAVQR